MKQRLFQRGVLASGRNGRRHRRLLPRTCVDGSLRRAVSLEPLVFAEEVVLFCIQFSKYQRGFLGRERRESLTQGHKVKRTSRICSIWLNAQDWQSAVTYVYRGARATRRAESNSLETRHRRPRRFRTSQLNKYLCCITERYACAAASGRVATTP